MYEDAIERSVRNPGRYAWFSRVPFLLALGAGIAAIIGLKALGWPQLNVTIVACGLIAAYAAIVWFVSILRLREDQLGDNCYYLGFLYTLISLCWALVEFSEGGSVEAIIGNFGIALGSTITGIALRVVFNQARRDVLETEREARLELARAVVRMRVEIDDAVLALASFCRTTQQVASEQINAAAEHAAAALEQGVAKVGEASGEVLARIDEAFTEMKANAVTLNKTSADTVRAVKALLARVERIEAPSDLVSRRLEPAFAAVEAAAVRLTERLKADETQLEVMAARSRVLQKDLESAAGAARSVTQGLASAAGAAADASGAGQAAAAGMTALSTSAEASLRAQERLANAVGAETDRILGVLRAHNDALEVEVERSRRVLSETSGALADLVENLVERVG